MNLIIVESIETTGTEWGISRTSHNPEPRDYIAVKSDEDARKFMDWHGYMVCESCNHWRHKNQFSNVDQCNVCAATK